MYNILCIEVGDSMNHKQIAELANVSASTVSKALSGSKEINAETAENIRRIAIENGYFKEKNKRKRVNTANRDIFIAVMVPEAAGGHYSKEITLIKEYIEEKGGNVAVYIFDFDARKKEKLLNSIILRGVADGVIISSTPPKNLKSNIPIVSLANDGIGGYDTVVVDGDAIVDDAVKYLKNLGHEKIGFAGEYHTIAKSNRFKKAMTNNGLKFSEKYMYIVDGRFETIGIKAAEKIVAAKDRPTAILAAYDEIALSLVHELTENGIRVPEDMSVMGINNIDSSAYAGIPLTTVNIFSDEQYKTAVNLLFDKILNETKSVRHIVVEHEIIERQTTKKLEK